MEEAEVARQSEDYRQADLTPADRAMLDYAAKLTTYPSAIKKEDVNKLKEAGFSEAAILDI